MATGEAAPAHAPLSPPPPSLGRDRMSQGDSNPAATPHIAEDVQGDGRWMSQHSRFVLDCKDKEPDVLFVGDSMVQLLQQYEIWRELFSPLHALNFGIGGDTTGHVLWRLKNGELENIKPKVIVVWVGTNNHENTAEEVAGGIEAIVRLINTQQPQAKIIVLGLLPRGEKPNPLRQKNSKVPATQRSANPSMNSSCSCWRKPQKRNRQLWPDSLPSRPIPAPSAQFFFPWHY
ncbi:platelet-activating factor acetylhydrolase IB subunit alpha2 isoform 3-T3 [Vipera latastei]